MLKPSSLSSSILIASVCKLRPKPLHICVRKLDLVYRLMLLNISTEPWPVSVLKAGVKGLSPNTLVEMIFSPWEVWTYFSLKIVNPLWDRNAEVDVLELNRGRLWYVTSDRLPLTNINYLSVLI